MTNEYLKKDNMNIITVNWSTLANRTYTKSSENAYGVGKKIGDLLIAMNKLLGVPFGLIHVIGCFLGAQVAGYIGKHVRNETGYSVGRITGLDPDGRLFNSYPSILRLSDSDADFVDVIHTDAGRKGINYNAGHADFYPNNGKRSQPYCRHILCFISENHSKYTKLYQVTP